MRPGLGRAFLSHGLWSLRLGPPFLPSSLLLPFLPLQVGIQVASEDLCSEKQWSVCKALATFVAHRELSKVGGYTWPLRAAGPPGCLSWQARTRVMRLGVSGGVGVGALQGIHRGSSPQLWPDLRHFPSLLFSTSPCVSRGILQISSLPYVSYRPRPPSSVPLPKKGVWGHLENESDISVHLETGRWGQRGRRLVTIQQQPQVCNEAQPFLLLQETCPKHPPMPPPAAGEAEADHAADGRGEDGAQRGG